MIEALIKHPAGIGTAKLVIYPTSLDLKHKLMLTTVELKNTQEMVIDRHQVLVDNDDLRDYLNGEVTPDTLIQLVVTKLNYTLIGE
jgi:hypothetical protein